jgi:hypothetical protein
MLLYISGLEAHLRIQNMLDILKSWKPNVLVNQCNRDSWYGVGLIFLGIVVTV